MPQHPRQHPTSYPEPLVPAWASALARSILILALITAGALLPPAASDADPQSRIAALDDRDSQEDRIERGRALFGIHCANCHGEHALGNGPMAKLLRTEVPDLTLLAERHDGEYPAQHVHQIIDGRFEVESHGRREMPIWGLSFQERGRTQNQEQQVQERLRDLVEYLRSIQRDLEGNPR